MGTGFNQIYSLRLHMPTDSAFASAAFVTFHCFTTYQQNYLSICSKSVYGREV